MADQQNVQQNVQPVVQLVIQPVGQQQQGVNPVAKPAGNVQAAHAQAVQGANGGINLKVKKAKLPEFWGQKDKVSIAAQNLPRESTGSCLPMVGQMKRLITTSAWLFVDPPTSG
jgi:hypothetical protein